MSTPDDPVGIRRAIDEGLILNELAALGPAILVTAASRHGSTREIAELIGQALRERGLDATVLPPEDVGDLADYEAVVLGSAVYAGHWLPEAIELAQHGGAALAQRPVWLFSSGPVGDPSRKLVQKMGADPLDLPDLLTATGARGHRTFAGRLDRRTLPLLQRAALTVVRGLKGDFRDRDAIRAWAHEIADALTLEPAVRA